jgi:hypothetical protein
VLRWRRRVSPGSPAGCRASRAPRPDAVRPRYGDVAPREAAEVVVVAGAPRAPRLARPAFPFFTSIVRVGRVTNITSTPPAAAAAVAPCPFAASVHVQLLNPAGYGRHL